MWFVIKRLFLYAFSLFYGLLSAHQVWAAACCGGGVSIPSLIAGDDKALFSAAYSYSQIASDVYTDGLWRKRTSNETIETLRLESAHIFADRWQVGASVPIVRRARAEDSSSGLGDLGTTLGYEYLPDWNYNPWRPKGIGYLQLTFPTGRSIQESESDFQLDSRGRGFWALALGTILSKGFERWDFFANISAHRSLSKSYSNSSSRGELKPGWGTEAALGVGYNLANLRLGGSLAWTYEDAVDVEGDVNSKGSSQRFATGSLIATYNVDDDWTTSLSYQDQTWFGSPANTTLSQGLWLQVQRRFAR